MLNFNITSIAFVLIMVIHIYACITPGISPNSSSRFPYMIGNIRNLRFNVWQFYRNEFVVQH